MRITRSSRLFGVIVAATATAGAVYLYAMAKSKIAAMRQLGEGTTEEVASALHGTRLWLIIACVMALVTVLVALIRTSDDHRNKG